MVEQCEVFWVQGTVTVATGHPGGPSSMFLHTLSSNIRRSSKIYSNRRVNWFEQAGLTFGQYDGFSDIPLDWTNC